MDRDLAAYHGVEHKAIAAYEQGIEDVAAVPKEHDRCGSNLIVPMMLLSAGGTVAARAPGRASRARSPAPASASAAPRSRSRCSPGATATTATRWPRPSTLPGREIQRRLATKEPTPRAARGRPGGDGRDPPGRGTAAAARTSCRRPHRLAAVFGRIDHIGVAVEDIDAAHRALRAELRDDARAPRDGRVPGRRGGPARRRRRPRRAAGAARPRHRRRQVPGQATAQACTTSPTRSTTSTPTLERLAAAGIELIDAEPRVGIRDSRVAFLHPRSTGGVLTEIVEPAGGH